MKRLMFFLALALFCRGLTAAANPVLSVGSASAAVNSDVTIKVTASGLNNLSAWSFKLYYDRSSLIYESTAKGTATAGWMYVDGGASSGHVQLVGASGPSGNSISGDNQQLCSVTFRTKDDAYSTSVTLMPDSPDLDLRRASLIPGQVTITTLPPLKLTLGSLTANAGTTITVAATAAGLSGSTYWGFDVAYDTKRLNFVALQNGAATKNWKLTNSMVDGRLRIQASGGAISGASLEICKISFFIQPGPAATLKLCPTRPKVGLNGAKLKDGKITVKASPAKKKK